MFGASSSLLFAFGTPLYAILFYGLAGLESTAHGVSLDFSVDTERGVSGGGGSMDALANALSPRRQEHGRKRILHACRRGAWQSLAGVVDALVVVVRVSLVVREPFLRSRTRL